jgi:outer membrane protein TolC
MDYETLLGNLLTDAQARDETKGIVSASKLLLQAVSSAQKSALNDQAPISALGTTIAKSYAKHPQSRVIGSRINQVSANADQAFSALMPQVTFSADYGRRSIDKTPYSSAQKYHFDATTNQLSLRQLIFDFGSTIGSYQAAKRTKVATCLRIE